MYGKELIIDLYKCNVDKFGEESLREFLEKLCVLTDMKREDLHFWKYDDLQEKLVAPIHLSGTSAVQFIKTSNIVIHTLDKINECMINFFTCKPFLETEAIDFIIKWFDSSQYEYTTIIRGRLSQCQNM